MNTLVVGATSEWEDNGIIKHGLGFEVARVLSQQGGGEIIITGRHDPGADFARYHEFDLDTTELPAKIGAFIAKLPPIRTLVYAAGFFQEGHITDLTDEQVDRMFNIGGRGLVFFIKKLLEKQGRLEEFIPITSSSAEKARELEAVYNFVKAGGNLYSKAQSFDPMVHRTLLVQPEGMDSPFWKNTDKDTSMMMPTPWVAEQIRALRNREHAFCHARILRQTGSLPRRVEIVEPYQVHYGALAVASLIKNRRLDLDLTATEVADMAGIARQYYSQVENAKPQNPTKTKPWRPSRKLLLYLADALQLDDTEMLIAAGYATG